jgi:hypothetical protein
VARWWGRTQLIVVFSPRRFLHPDAVALGTSPLSLLVVDVALQFLHLNSAFLADHWIAPDLFLFLQAAVILADEGADLVGHRK